MKLLNARGSWRRRSKGSALVLFWSATTSPVLCGKFIFQHSDFIIFFLRNKITDHPGQKKKKIVYCQGECQRSHKQHLDLGQEKQIPKGWERVMKNRHLSRERECIFLTALLMNSHDLLQPFKRVWDGWHCWLCSLILTFPMQQGCERGVPVLEYSHNAMDLLWAALKPQHNLRTSLHFELCQTIR